MAEPYTVIFDVVTWQTPPKDPRDRKNDFHIARRGETMPEDTPQSELDRLVGLDAIAQGAAAVKGLAEAGEPVSWSETQLASANVEDTIAYLSQHPSEARSILEREMRGNKGGRKGVLKAAERIADEYDAEVERQLAEQAQADDAEQRAYAQAAGVSSGTPAIPQPGS